MTSIATRPGVGTTAPDTETLVRNLVSDLTGKFGSVEEAVKAIRVQMARLQPVEPPYVGNLEQGPKPPPRLLTLTDLINGRPVEVKDDELGEWRSGYMVGAAPSLGLFGVAFVDAREPQGVTLSARNQRNVRLLPWDPSATS